MSTITLKIFFAISVFLVILLAGWYPLKKRKKNTESLDLPIGETLATGVFLGAGLLHLFPFILIVLQNVKQCLSHRRRIYWGCLSHLVETGLSLRRLYSSSRHLFHC
jgi:hypothetical protein